MMYYYFYKITNLINGKFYYGVHSTDDLDDGYMGSGKLLHKAIKKYGIENFKKDILKYFDNKDDMYEYEKIIVNKELLKNPNCYNLKCGGQKGFQGLIFTEEHRRHMSENHADVSGEKNPFYGKTHSEEFSKTHSARMTGRKASEETKLKMSVSKQGHLTSDITREKISKANKGRKPTDETLKKLSESHKGKFVGAKWINNGTINKFVKPEELYKYLNNGWQLGYIMKKKRKHPSEETKRKQSEIHKGEQWINNGFIEKRVKGPDIDLFLNNGWSLGRIKLKKK